MIQLRMPLVVTVGLLGWFILILILLCVGCVFFVRRGVLLGSLAFGAFWAILDWITCTLVPVWGLAQSFARSWTAWPFLIQLISLTGICGIPLALGTLQGLAAHGLVNSALRKRAAIPIAWILIVLGIVNAVIWLQKPTGDRSWKNTPRPIGPPLNPAGMAQGN